MKVLNSDNISHCLQSTFEKIVEINPGKNKAYFLYNFNYILSHMKLTKVIENYIIYSEKKDIKIEIKESSISLTDIFFIKI